MESIIVGKIVNTFGIKGELKIISDFEKPDKVFIKGQKLIINKNNYLITNVRYHKNNYLLELNDIHNINDIIYLKGYDVYIDINNIKLKDNEYLICQLINYEVYDNDELIGKITGYNINKSNPLIKVNNEFYIPLNGDFIIKVDKVNKKVFGHNLKGLRL